VAPKNIALVDCNNFYVSCERLFRPDLAEKPVAVLSNNDGCIVARSQEVKRLGIKMAVPLYQVRHLVKQHDIQLFSSNYALYADLSARIMQSLDAFSPNVDVYSIDEAFVDLDSQYVDLKSQGLNIKNSLFRWVGIPVSVGIGPTKTLAKLANYAAKKWPNSGGVVDINEPLRRQKIMQRTEVGEVWGVGRQYSQKLNQLGIYTVWDLQSQSTRFIRQYFNISLVQIVQELQGRPVHIFNPIEKAKQQIVCSRSFKKKLHSERELAQTLSVFCLRSAEKLRAQQGFAKQVSVFICSSPFDQECGYSKKSHYRLKSATQDSRDLLKIVRNLLSQIYKSGVAYQQAGVVLSDIHPRHENQQYDLFSLDHGQGNKSNQLMKTLDDINSRFNNKLSFASIGNKTLQQSVPINRSRAYTTNWNELASVK